jgi:sulfur relay protein TusB/DsrH
MLHLIFQASAIMPALQRADRDDAAVFLDNAIFGLKQKSSFLSEKSQNIRFYVLAEDLTIRGIGRDMLIIPVEAIDYNGLVNLTLTHNKIQSWN